MLYSTDNVKKVYVELDLACGSCRARVGFLKIWKNTNDFQCAMNNIWNYPGVNQEQLVQIRDKYET